MGQDAATSYDTLPYHGNFIPMTHPDRMAAMAILHGMKPPAVERCRSCRHDSTDSGDCRRDELYPGGWSGRRDRGRHRGTAGAELCPVAIRAGKSRRAGRPTEFGFGLGVVSGLFLGVGTGVFLVCVLTMRDAWLARSGIMPVHAVKAETPFE